MTIKIVIFFISICVVFITSVLIYKQRLGDAGNRRMIGFYPLCIVTLLWTAVDAVKQLAAPDYFTYVFVIKVIIACIVPYICFWFILNFTESKLAQSGMMKSLLIAIPALDIFMLITSPLHKLYFINFDYPAPSTGTMPPVGPVFWIHILFVTAGVFFFYAILFRYIVKNFSRYPFLIITGIGVVIPFFLNIAFALNLFGLSYDLSPIGFFCTIVLFTYFSYASRTRNYRPQIFSETLVRITKSPMLSAGNIAEAAEMITREGCLALGADNVGIWNLNGHILKNMTLFERKDGKSRVPSDIDLSNCPGYIEMMLNERRIAVDDVRVPNVLSPVISGYDPEICAFLDTPVRINGKLTGIVCVEQRRCEAYPEKREWTAEEQNFASSLADCMTIALESAERRALLHRTEAMMNNLPGMMYQCVQTSQGFFLLSSARASRKCWGIRSLS